MLVLSGREILAGNQRVLEFFDLLAGRVRVELKFVHDTPVAIGCWWGLVELSNERVNLRCCMHGLSGSESPVAQNPLWMPLCVWCRGIEIVKTGGRGRWLIR